MTRSLLLWMLVGSMRKSEPLLSLFHRVFNTRTLIMIIGLLMGVIFTKLIGI
jgi:hypothetical protein